MADVPTPDEVAATTGAEVETLRRARDATPSSDDMDMDELYRPDSMPDRQCDECGSGASGGWCIVCAQPVGEDGDE